MAGLQAGRLLWSLTSHGLCHGFFRGTEEGALEHHPNREGRKTDAGYPPGTDPSYGIYPFCPLTEPPSVSAFLYAAGRTYGLIETDPVGTELPDLYSTLYHRWMDRTVYWGKDPVRIIHRSFCVVYHGLRLQCPVVSGGAAAGIRCGIRAFYLSSGTEHF